MLSALGPTRKAGGFCFRSDTKRWGGGGAVHLRPDTKSGGGGGGGGGGGSGASGPIQKAGR